MVAWSGINLSLAFTQPSNFTEFVGIFDRSTLMADLEKIGQWEGNVGGGGGEGVIYKCRQMTDKYYSAQQDNPSFLKTPPRGMSFATKLLAPVL